MIRLYNTMSRQLEDFKTLEESKVGLYTCGLTVYSHPHIGNWVAYIYWDILVRMLRANGLEVNHVQNITDVGHLTSDEDAGEDKMLKGALREGKTAWEVADTYIAVADQEAFEQLGLQRPTHMPRATEFIQQQIDFVKVLEDKGFTYAIADGVYFDTSKLSDYGKLARLDIDGLRFGARVESTGKKNPTDFALWKFSPADQQRDMEWDSPWGKGFPGWHLECSVMAREFLGDTIDIHTGGIDHIPVHHSNEIAQSETVTSKPFSKYWLHANHIKVNGTKISKSLGNGYTLEDVETKGYDLQAFKLMVLSKHYRTEGNFTWEILDSSQNRLNSWQAAADLRWQPQSVDQWISPDLSLTTVEQALTDDLNTPLAISTLDGFFAQVVENLVSEEEVHIFNQRLTKLQELIGINLMKPDISDEQKQVIAERTRAREAGDWAKSDELRDHLKSQGIEVRDTQFGTLWSRF